MMDAERQEPTREPNAGEEQWTAGTGGEIDVPGSWTSAMNALLGLGLLFLSPWLKDLSGDTVYPLSLINNVAAGALIALLGFLGSRSRSSSYDLGQAIVGGWLLVAPFVIPGHASEGFDSFFAGTLVTLLAVIGMVLKAPLPRRRAM